MAATAPSRFEQHRQLQGLLDWAAQWADSSERRAHIAAMARFAFTLAQEDQARERQAARLPIVFRRVHDVWEIGEIGQSRQMPATSVGVAAAHQAMCGGRPPTSKALAHAVRNTAPAWAERGGCIRLAAAMRRISEQAGSLVYLPGPSAPMLILD